MSESLGKNDFECCDIKPDNNAPIFKGSDSINTIIGTFDAELDLLESTLSELKQDDDKSTTCKHSIEIFNTEPYQKICQSCSKDSLTCRPTNECQSLQASTQCYSSYNCNEVTESLHKSSSPTTQHFESTYLEGRIVVGHTNLIKRNSVLYSNSCEGKSDITNCCPQEVVLGKPVLFDIDQTCPKVISNKNECDLGLNLQSRPNPLMKCLETTEVNNIGPVTVSLGLRSEQTNQATKHSEGGCDFHNLNPKYPFRPNLVTSVQEPVLASIADSHDPSVGPQSKSNQEYLSGFAVTMDERVGSSDSCDLIGPNIDVDRSTMENSTSDITKADSGLSQHNQLIAHKDMCENQEDTEKNDVEENCNSLVNKNTTPCKQSGEKPTNSQVCDESVNDKPIKNQGIFFSTPNVNKNLQDSNCSSDAVDFGLVSPLNVRREMKGKQNLKRKHLGLQPIEEIDEDTDTVTEKKMKVDGESDSVADPVPPSEASTSALPCYEAPAKSLLKKWQPSCLSRNVSASSFIVLDECGETEFEDCSKLSQEHEPSRADDFEIACQSLTEELMKSSSNIETLEKYHSQVQLENQMDDEKFDEILKELTMNVDMDDKTCLSLKSMDESSISRSDDTSCLSITVKESVDASTHNTENRGGEEREGSPSDNDRTITEENNHIATSDEPFTDKKKLGTLKKEQISETGESTTKEPVSVKEEPNVGEEEEIDEEDYLLDENINTKDKPYEFFEFVSSDPKENEDNYNPEWQKLGRLTSDEERYKAVRDRWRSLVPPDPNRNLTFRQWRARNNKSPIKLSPLNNNHQLMDDNEKNQLCTAVFDNKIKKIVQELEDSRMNIYRERNREFESLAHIQDEEQMRASMRGFSYPELAQLHCKHLNQCRSVKAQYDQELKRIENITQEKIRILREASEEVLLFQKFYRGVGASDESEMYLTDIQVQELMETEDMLEQYKEFYK